jgi:dissimilatory sulfite reductase (desulfoviridin) alpha/beta subunit
MNSNNYFPCQATSVVPDLNTIKAIQKIAWSSGSGSLHLVHASNEEIHKAHEKVMSQVSQTLFLLCFLLCFI